MMLQIAAPCMFFAANDRDDFVLLMESRWKPRVGQRVPRPVVISNEGTPDAHYTAIRILGPMASRFIKAVRDLNAVFRYLSPVIGVTNGDLVDLVNAYTKEVVAAAVARDKLRARRTNRSRKRRKGA